jgi:hypothetical protein
MRERPEEYEPPAIEVLGTLEELTGALGIKQTDLIVGSPLL